MDTKLNFRLTLLSFFLFFSSCSLFFPYKNISELVTPIPESQKNLFIPTYPDSTPYVYWHLAKQKEAQLELPKLETANTYQTFRIWITNPVGRRSQPHGLININCEKESCTGNLYLMKVDFNSRELSETIRSKQETPLEPKNLSWKAISDSLIILKFDQLPTDEEIPDYYADDEGYANNLTTFSFEYSTNFEYRFYQYNNIYRKPDNFWQVQNVISILDLLEDEFQWDTRGREYFK